MCNVPFRRWSHNQNSGNANTNSHEHVSTSRAHTHTHTHTLMPFCSGHTHNMRACLHCTPRRTRACLCSLKAANRLVCFSRVCSIRALPLSLAPSHTLLPHNTESLIRQSVTRSPRHRSLSPNLYIVNPGPGTLKPKAYARI